MLATELHSDAMTVFILETQSRYYADHLSPIYKHEMGPADLLIPTRGHIYRARHTVVAAGDAGEAQAVLHLRARLTRPPFPILINIDAYDGSDLNLMIRFSTCNAMATDAEVSNC